MSDNANFKEQIEKLVKLKEIDNQIYDMQSKKETFPERIKEMDNSLESKTTGLVDAEDSLKQIKIKKNEKENDLRDKEEQINKHQSQLYLIRNNKEYTALQQEIDSLKADASLLEEEIIVFFDEIEEAYKNKEKEKAVLSEEKAAVETEKNAIREEEKKLLRNLEGLKAERKEDISSIDEKLLQLYERILNNKGRTALAIIDDESCGGCYMSLRPQIINDAKLKKDIVLCENCGRMLYVED